MKKNVGTIDGYVRITVGSLLIYIGFCGNPIISDGIGKLLIGIFGLIIMSSGIFHICPLYWLAGIDTKCNEDRLR